MDGHIQAAISFSTSNSGKLCCVAQPHTIRLSSRANARELGFLAEPVLSTAEGLEMTRQIVTSFPNNDTVLGEKRTNRGGSPGGPRAESLLEIAL